MLAGYKKATTVTVKAKPFSHFRQKTTWQNEYKFEKFMEFMAALNLSYGAILIRPSLPHPIKRLIY